MTERAWWENTESRRRTWKRLPGWEFYRDRRDQWIGRFRAVDPDGTDRDTYYAFLTLVARRKPRD
jgi:hypothetical protein